MRKYNITEISSNIKEKMKIEKEIMKIWIDSQIIEIISNKMQKFRK
jgi:hypothetical protein